MYARASVARPILAHRCVPAHTFRHGIWSCESSYPSSHCVAGVRAQASSATGRRPVRDQPRWRHEHGERVCACRADGVCEHQLQHDRSLVWCGVGLARCTYGKGDRVPSVPRGPRRSTACSAKGAATAKDAHQVQEACATCSAHGWCKLSISFVCLKSRCMCAAFGRRPWACSCSICRSRWARACGSRCTRSLRASALPAASDGHGCSPLTLCHPSHLPSLL